MGYGTVCGQVSSVPRQNWTRPFLIQDISPIEVSSLTIIGTNSASWRLPRDRSSRIFMVVSYGFLGQFVDQLACSGHTVFDGPVHDDAAPTVGPFRAGKPHARAGVQDVLVPVDELSGAQG